MIARDEIKSEALLMEMFGSTLWTEILRTVGNRKKKTNKLLEEKTDLFTISRNIDCSENRILFPQPSLAIPLGREARLQWLHKHCPSVQTDLYSSLGWVIPSVYPVLHCTCWMPALAFWTRLLKTRLDANPQIGLNCHDLSPARWPALSKLAPSPLRGCTGRNGIKGLAKQCLEEHRWFCCWKCHTFGSHYVAGYFRCVIYFWCWSQWNYQLWIILCEEFWQFTSKILVPWRLVFHTDAKQMHVFQVIFFCSLSPANKFSVCTHIK